MKEGPIVLNTSPETATFTNVTGWVDRHGRFWGNDERAARWSGCTHIVCPECGRPTERSWTICHDCSVKKDNERFAKQEQKEWDHETPLYSRVTEGFFWNEGELDDYCYDEQTTPDKLELIICVPIYAHQIESDWWYDELPDEEEIPDGLATAIAIFNESIKDLPPLSWSPGKYRAMQNMP
jgi:hypothetical protein